MSAPSRLNRFEDYFEMAKTVKVVIKLQFVFSAHVLHVRWVLFVRNFVKICLTFFFSYRAYTISILKITMG